MPLSAKQARTGATITNSRTILENSFKTTEFTKVQNGATTFNLTFGNNSVLLDIPTSDGSLLNYARYDDWVSSRENFKLSETFVVETISAQNEGLGFYLKPQSGDLARSFSYAFITGNVANKGKHVWVVNDTVAFYSSGTLAVSAGDSICTTIEKIGASYIMTSINLTQGGSLTDIYTFSFIYPATLLIPPYIKFGLCSFGGQHTVYFFNVSTNEVEDCDILFIGDSKTVGYYAGSEANTFTNLIKTDFPTKKICVSAGGGGTTKSALKVIEELKSYNAKKVFIFLGCNDVRIGSAYQTFYPQLVDELEKNGSEIYHILSAPENAIDVTSLNTFISTRYVSGNILNAYTLLWSGFSTSLNVIYNSGDGVHLNAAGELVIKNLVSSSI